MTGPGGFGSERRELWERRWQQREGSDFDWHRDTMPVQLVELLSTAAFPPGAALDLGCGDGVVTWHLSKTFQPVVGVDIAFGAVARAARCAPSEPPVPCFAVMDAARPGFRSAGFAFVFDRGCLQNLPQSAWPAYFREVERMLIDGGLLQLFCCKAAKDSPPLLSRAGLSKKGLLARAASLRGRHAGPQFASQEYIRQLLPASLTPIVQADIPTHLKSGNVRTEMYGLFKKTA